MSEIMHKIGEKLHIRHHGKGEEKLESVPEHHHDDVKVNHHTENEGHDENTNLVGKIMNKIHEHREKKKERKKKNQKTKEGKKDKVHGGRQHPLEEEEEEEEDEEEEEESESEESEEVECDFEFEF